MGKYTSFGLAFAKSFLVEQGANPVFYIANNSKLRLWTFGVDTVTTHFESRADYFDKKFSEFYDCMWEVKQYLHKNAKDSPEADVLSGRLDQVDGFLNSLFGFFKCFDASKDEDDKENFYMEREWRLKGSLNFKASDVQRVIIPQSFVSRISIDFPISTPAAVTTAEEIMSIRIR